MVVGVEDDVASQVEGVTATEVEAEAKALGEVVDLGEGLEHQVEVVGIHARTGVLDDEVEGGDPL